MLQETPEITPWERVVPLNISKYGAKQPKDWLEKLSTYTSSTTEKIWVYASFWLGHWKIEMIIFFLILVTAFEQPDHYKAFCFFPNK